MKKILVLIAVATFGLTNATNGKEINKLNVKKFRCTVTYTFKRADGRVFHHGSVPCKEIPTLRDQDLNA